MTKGPSCIDCGTRLSKEPWAPELCPRCSLQLALEQSPVEIDVGDDPEALPTRQFPTQTFSPGQILGSRFQIRSLLGRGGMGEVWRAYDLKLRVDVALKSLRAELLEKERALQALRQEVRTAREVMSPNVCRVFDLVELDGQELVSMEYIDGTTLVTVLHSRGPLDLQEAREIASQFLAGLEAIHQAELVHRDLKPENIMITRSGRVVVMDFGIAKGLADRKTGTVSGTPAYMAPEQARGGEVDARADVFSAGVVLAEMIAPNGIKTPKAREEIWQGIHHEPPELPDTPWVSVLTKAVARLAGERYPSAAALARALEEVTLQVEGAEDVRPYPGLASFTEEDAEYFFGRELEVEAMWKKLRRPHLLGLIGPSGAGKSSFLRAGLLPVMPEGWRVLVTTPGGRPFTNLARVLVHELASDTHVTEQFIRFEEADVAVSLFHSWRQQFEHALVIVDQFEELFTLNAPEVQERFAGLLGRLAIEADVHVLLSMRDDFLYHCHNYEPLHPLLSELTLLGPPTGTALRRAVVQPALKCGYRFEDESLVEAILSEVEEERGALPMVAFAAARLWEHRDRERGLLTKEAYEHVGGVGGALAQHAEATLEKIGTDRIPIVREIFRNLVTAQGTRAARHMKELLSVFENQGEAEEVLRALVDARLLTSFEVTAGEEEEKGQHRVEIIHESLLKAWPRLVRWQTQDEDGAQLRDELRQAAQLWEQHGRSADRLWTGTPVKEFQLWRERYPGGLTTTEDAFAQAMVQQAERRRKRKRFAIAATIIVLVGVVALLGAFWQRSETAREEAVNEARRAEASELLALGQLQLEHFPSASVAYALKSLELADAPEARLFALEALQKGPTALIMNDTSQGIAHGVDVTPDGRWLVFGGIDSAQLLSRDGGPPVLVAKYPVTASRMVFVKFTPAGDRLVTAKHGEIRIYSVPDGQELAIRKIEPVATKLWMGNHSFYTVSSVEGGVVVRRWPFDGGEPSVIGRMDLEAGIGTVATGGKYAVGIDPTGKWFAYGQGRRVYLQSLEDWDMPPTGLGEHSKRVVPGLDFHADKFATRDESGEIRVWSVGSSSNEPVNVLQGMAMENGPRFDASGKRLIDYGIPEGWGTIKLWHLDWPPEAESLTILRGQNRYVNGAVFDPSGRWLATADSGDGVTIWHLTRPDPLVLRGHEYHVYAVAFTPDGKRLVSGSMDGTVRAWFLDGGKPSRVLLNSENLVYPYIDIDPSGRKVLASGHGGKVFLVPLEGGSPRELEGFSSATVVGPVAFGPSGRLAAAATGPMTGPTEEKVIRVWDLESRECRVLGPVESAGDRLPEGFLRLHFLPDGRLLSCGPDGLHLWDVEHRTMTLLESGLSTCDLNPDGRHVLVNQLDRKNRVWRLKWMDLLEGRSRPLGQPRRGIPHVVFDPTGALAVSGSRDGIVHAGPVSGGNPHLLFGHEGFVRDVAVSPDGQWIASAGDDKTIRLWPMPDIDQQPFHRLPYEELLERLRNVTNVRVVEDEASSTGYKIDIGPFPGWEKVPEW